MAKKTSSARKGRPAKSAARPSSEQRAEERDKYFEASMRHFYSKEWAVNMNRSVKNLIKKGTLKDDFAGAIVMSDDELVYIVNVAKGWVEGISAVSLGQAPALAQRIMNEHDSRIEAQKANAEPEEDEEDVEDDAEEEE